MKPTKSPTPLITTRRYQPGDREAVRRLHNEALYDVGAHLGEGPWDDLDAVESVYLEDGGEFLIGILDEEIVAMGALRREREAQPLYEENGHRGIGRGTVGPFRCLYYERKSRA